MTSITAIDQLPVNRILELESQRLASFVKSEATYIYKIWDYTLGRVENRVIEKMLMRRLQKVFSAGNNTATLEAYLSKMRQDYASGRKETLSVFSHAADSLDFYDDTLAYMDDGEVSTHIPTPQSESNVLLYVVGGGFVLPPSRREREMVERLAKACDCKPILGQHRLAPENPFPKGAEDIAEQILVATKALGAKSKLFVSADTAGASLLMGALQLLRKQGVSMPSGILLFSPWCDLSLSGWSYITRSANADSPFRMETAAFCARLYLQGKEATHPLASAIYADLSGFPPMAIHTSQFDMHFDDAITLTENAKASGVECHVNYWDTPRHHLERLKSKDAQKSYEIAAEFIARVSKRVSQASF